MNIRLLPLPLFCAALLVGVQVQTPKNVEERDEAARVPLQVGGGVSAPRAIYSPEPEFSKAARKAGYQGICVLSLIVGDDGKPRDISVVRKLGMQLDEKAVEAVSNWRFEPAQKNGQPVAVQIQVEVSFHLYRHGQNVPSAEPSEPMLALSRVRDQIYRLSESPEPGICAHDARSGPLATIAELSLEGDFRMPSLDRDQITAALKQRTYSGELEGAESEISERVRAAWQSSGYFKVQAHTGARVLTSGPDRERIAVTVQVDEGQQYRLEEIRFRNNQAITNVEVLRQLFPVKDGDLFDRTAIGKGLENLRRVYGQFGYANATAVPETRFHEERQTISLDINLDEGRQFYVSRISVIGLDESAFQNVLKEMTVKPGDVYDQRLVDLFLQRSASLLSPDASSEPRFNLQLNEKQGTVAIRYDFRSCHVD
jgi:TonB family protein